VQVAQTVINEMEDRLPRGQAAAVARAIQRIGTEVGTRSSVPLKINVPGAPPGSRYLAAIPDDEQAPVVIYREPADKVSNYLVAALADRDTYRKYERAEQQGLLDDPVAKSVAEAVTEAALDGRLGPQL
jgi:hypothetical protein